MNNSLVDKILPPAIVGLMIVGLWYAAIYFFEIPIFQLPAPHLIVDAASKEHEALISGALQTTYACIVGFFSSLVGGVILSIVLAFSRWAYKGIYPFILLLKMMPVVVLAPIIILWFGQGLGSITVITFLICFFPIVANTTMGLCSTDPNLLAVFRAYNSSALDEMLRLRIPYAMPYFLTGLKIAAALTPIGALYGDTVAGMGSGADAGLGFVVVVFSSQLKIPALYAAAFTACAIGFIFVGLVNLLHWFVLRKWHDSYANEH